MIPLRDSVPTRNFPAINIGLILVNAVAFIHELSLPPDELRRYLIWNGLVPLRYGSPALDHAGFIEHWRPFVSSLFLHGGWLHLISNMWTLWIFGDNIEDTLGHFRYLLFYLLCGIAANVAQLWASWSSPLPTIGASGAIAGVMGAYFVLFPGARVVCLVPIFVFLQRVELPAAVFLGLWMWSQLYSGALALSGAGHAGGVAWWAHIGGFIGGIMLLGAFLGRRSRRRRRSRSRA